VRAPALQVFGALRGYRQMGVAARLASGGALLLLLLLLVSLFSLSLGPVDIPARHILHLALSAVGFDVAEAPRTEQLVIEQIRLPRIVVGASVGLALGVVGAALQGLFRNPTADPGTIGGSAGGAVGAGGAGPRAGGLPNQARTGVVAGSPNESRGLWHKR